MPGSVITFYSYKGGVGRSFALANIAVILAQWGFRVLAVDWDIEAPGLHHYYADLKPQFGAGVLDFIDTCARDAEVSWQDYASHVPLPDASGRLFLMPAALGGGADYTARVQTLDWDALYSDCDFGNKLEALRADWVRQFDFVLVDSRTGVTDFSGLTTAQLPDTLAFLFTANNQSLSGCSDIAHRALRARADMPLDRPALIPMPIPARFDIREEYDRAQLWKARFVTELGPFFDVWAPASIDRLRLIDLMTIPYIPRWTFGEELCVVIEPAGSDGVRTPGQGASFALETIAAVLANGFDKTNLLASSRDEFVHLARSAAVERHPKALARVRVFISAGSAPTDQLIARTIRQELRNNNIDTFYAPEDLIHPFSKYHQELGTELSECDALVLLLNDNSLRTQIYQTNEFLRYSIRTSRRRPIIPIEFGSSNMLL